MNDGRNEGGAAGLAGGAEMASLRDGEPLVYGRMMGSVLLAQDIVSGVGDVWDAERSSPV